MTYKRIGIVFMGMALSAASAQPLPQQERQDSDEARQSVQDPFAGVVLNQTVTVIGQDFYRHFVTAWRDKPMSERYTVSIHERPTAQLGSQVWIEYAQRKVFQIALPPSRSQIRAISEQAVEATHEAIVSTDMQRMLFRDQDMGPDEI